MKCKQAIENFNSQLMIKWEKERKTGYGVRPLEYFFMFLSQQDVTIFETISHRCDHCCLLMFKRRLSLSQMIDYVYYFHKHSVPIAVTVYFRVKLSAQGMLMLSALTPKEDVAQGNTPGFVQLNL